MKSKKIIPLIISIILITSFCGLSFAAEEDSSTADVQTTKPQATVVEIYDYEDLLGMENEPSGTYKLMADIDLSDVIWEPLDFSGSLDGNGHTIYNISVNQTSSKTRTTYDSSNKTYETCFAGFFGVLENATVTNLDLLGIKVNIETDENCFVAPLAGYINDSRVTECSITGEAWLYSSGQITGAGGICGFGSGHIEDCKTDVTIVSIDTDAQNMSQEFMGGAYASGCIDLKRNTLNFAGYDSEHGFVHSGGLAGAYMKFDGAGEIDGFMSNNEINGKISFFEENEEDRAAYCEAEVGEIVNWTFEAEGNVDNFTADEHFEYDNLLPHYCNNPVYSDNIYESSHTEQGYTLHSCTTCGEYTYRSDYRPLAHEVEDWTVTIEPTSEQSGVRQGTCTQCGEVVFEKVAKVESAEPVTEEETEPSEKGGSAFGTVLLIIIIIIVAALAVMYILTALKKARIKRQRLERKKAAKKRQRARTQNNRNRRYR